MEDEQRREFIRQVFNTVSEEYGQGNLRFFANAASHLPALLDLVGDEKVLDLAAGTGLASTMLARSLPGGSVTAIDISEGMLEKARQSADQLGLDNIDFRQMDMTRMDLQDNSFDVVNASFGMFFVEDMEQLARHAVSKLKPGGRLITTHFAAGSFSPMQELIVNRLARYGVEVPVVSWLRVDSEQANRELYQSAGLSEITHRKNQVGYFFEDAQGWWDVVWWAGYRGFVDQVDHALSEQFRQEHLDEVNALADDKGVCFHVEVIHTIGKKM